MSDYADRANSARKTVRAIVIHKSKVLVIERYKYGEEYVVLPGGGIDPGEADPKAQACRSS